MNWSKMLKPFVPGFALPTLRRLLHKNRDLKGDYSCWQSAMSNSIGYDNPSILEKTKQAMLKVKNGEAVHERDTVLFDRIEYSYPLLAGLMWVAATNKGILNVLDFGGSLGTTYFQNRLFLNDLAHVTWNIVEQEHYALVGKQFFEDSRLKFYASLDQCIASTRPNVAICSSSLQYVEKPYDVLSKFTDANIRCLIIDRTPFHPGDQDRLCVQHVPASIYSASYPMWIFSAKKLEDSILERRYRILADFDAFDRLTGPITPTYRGFIIVPK